MPIYEYSCKKCGTLFEVLIRNQTDIPKSCPDCGAKKPVKALSAFAVPSSNKTPFPHCTKCPTAGSTCPSGGTCTL